MVKLILICVMICCLTIVRSKNSCTKVLEKSESITDKIKEQIVDKHNKLRSLIVLGLLKEWPKGKKLYVIGWDDELAVEAQRRAELLCNGRLNTPATDDRFNRVGELAGHQAYSKQENGPNFEPIIQFWFDQHKSYKYPTFPSGFGQITMNVTQYVGCGYAHYLLTDKQYEKKYLCLYGPGIRFPYHDAKPTYELADTDRKS